MRKQTFVALALVVAGCNGEIDGGQSIRVEQGLSGCHGVASSSIPGSGDYYLTSFGNTPSDDGPMSCGEKTLHGSWYYAASRQRYGCGAHIQIEANGRCVVAETDDYGPDVCVENAAGRPIIDASPLVSEQLFGTDSAGFSDRFAIHVTEVDRSTPLGPCGASTNPPPLRSCHSATLGRDVPSGTCVQSKSDSVWYQCVDGAWKSGVDQGAGPAGTCSAEYPL